MIIVYNDYLCTPNVVHSLHMYLLYLQLQMGSIWHLAFQELYNVKPVN